MRIFLCLILFSCLFASVSAIQINEIMYNPSIEFGGTYNEWIEIYNPTNDIVNLTGWKIADPSDHDITGNNLSVLPYGFLIIAKNDTKFLEYFNVSCNVAKAGFSLSNDGEEILLKNSTGQIANNVTYNKSWGANGDNDSLQLVNGTWRACVPTPGMPNNCSAPADATEENITELAIIYKPSNAIFGGRYELFIGFNSTIYNYENIKLLIYGLHERVIADSNGNKITSYASCQNGEILNVTKGQSYFWTLPFFTYPNCDKDYADGTYEIALRACRPSGADYTKYLEEFFSLNIAGKNSALCPSETKTSGGSSSGNEITTYTSPDFEIEILDYPKSIETGEIFNITVELKSNLATTESFDVYSYIYSGKTPLTEGGWTGNKQTILLTNNATNITLINKVKANAPLGNYTLKARASLEDKKFDDITSIEIIQGEVNQDEEEFEIETKANTTDTMSLVTGSAVWTGSETKTSTYALLLFCFVLLIFVVVLIKKN